ENAYVSAYFEDVNNEVNKKLEKLGYPVDEDNSVVLSRKISSLGKSQCRINGKSASVTILKELGGLLVNIHGQHDSQALLNPELQYNYIDMLSKDGSYLANYKASFKKLLSIRRALKSLTMSENDKDRELELLEYQIKELEEADIKIGERESLTKRRELIQKSESIAKALNIALGALNGDDENDGVSSVLANVQKQLMHFDECRQASDILENVSDGLELFRDKLEELSDNLSFDESELEEIEERLDLLYRFSHKYGNTEEEMLAFLDDARKRANAIIYSDEELERLNAEYDKVFGETVRLAEELSNHRKVLAKEFEKEVKEELTFLDMPKLEFVVRFEKGNLSSNGFDKIEFLISTNVGEPPKPMAKIASGGELSRIMLAIKNILSYNDIIGTLIFDEIDTGVSGSASDKIGLKLKSVSKNTQVICVTHSAQIASKADDHFLIQKEFTSNSTYTKVSLLDFEGRKRELARIMGGAVITDTLLKSAEELLTN
ncbi:MAG: DNA repair protein RecN, partial [Eubacterium sp.]|nr:DNA repair protein RecN [Eubacterium sp.]